MFLLRISTLGPSGRVVACSQPKPGQCTATDSALYKNLSSSVSDNMEGDNESVPRNELGGDVGCLRNL